MGRLCGGVHEMSGIKAPLFLCGWVVGRGGEVAGGGGVGGGWVGVVGWVVVGRVVWWGGGWSDEIIFPIKFKFSKIVPLV